MSDWADDLAETLVNEVREITHSRSHAGGWNFDVPYDKAVELVAARLRLVKCEGECAGLEQARKAIAP
jgi:hypothetical protein